MTTTVRVHQSGAYWRRQFTSNAIDYTEAPDTIKWFTRCGTPCSTPRSTPGATGCLSATA
jgi:hypothetical protein